MRRVVGWCRASAERKKVKRRARSPIADGVEDVDRTTTLASATPAVAFPWPLDVCGLGGAGVDVDVALMRLAGVGYPGGEVLGYSCTPFNRCEVPRELPFHITRYRGAHHTGGLRISDEPRKRPGAKNVLNHTLPKNGSQSAPWLHDIFYCLKPSSVSF